MRGIDLGGCLHRRWLADSEKWPERQRLLEMENKRLLPAVTVVVEVLVTGTP